MGEGREEDGKGAVIKVKWLWFSQFWGERVGLNSVVFELGHLVFALFGVVCTWQQRHDIFMSSEMGSMITNVTVHTWRQQKVTKKHIVVIKCEHPHVFVGHFDSERDHSRKAMLVVNLVGLYQSK